MKVRSTLALSQRYLNNKNSSAIDRRFIRDSRVWRDVEKVASAHPNSGLFENCSSIRLRDYRFVFPESTWPRN